MMAGQFKEETRDTSRTENEYLPERKGSGRQAKEAHQDDAKAARD
ncbi:hypothetical protein SOASR031_10850 [Leminorella grimontii]|nr:hypothetical protein SOASR031_10850 [Leminorella grimontii]